MATTQTLKVPGKRRPPKMSAADKITTRQFKIFFRDWKKKQPQKQKSAIYFSAQLGFGRSFIYDMLQGRRPVSDGVLSALVAKFNCSYEWLINGTGDQIKGVEKRHTIHDVQHLQEENDKRIQDLLRQAARMTGVENELEDLKKEFTAFKIMVSEFMAKR